MMKKGRSKFGVWLCSAFMGLIMLTMAMGLAACGDAKDLKIDVPSRIEADLGTGTYVVPRYDVVNGKGLIMAGYNVRLKSAKNPDGTAADIAQEASTVVTLSGAGEYTFVYTADNKNVPDATVIMDFADRKAPTIKLSSSQFPSFFIKGNSYAVPEYTLEGNYDASKCYTKVYYNSGAENEQDSEITLTNGYFAVDRETGKYTVHIHVENASGVGNDYRYTRSVYSPENYEEDIVIYFNEKFGERQVAPDGNYAGEYVSVLDGGKAYGDELGSYKVEFTGETTENNEAYFALNVPAITNVMDNKELEMYVYIDDADCQNEKKQWVIGSKWWNDQTVKVGEWTRVTWSIDNWGNGKGANCGANTTQVISTDNISGTRIRLIPDSDYGSKTPPHGTVYFSAMRLVPHKWATITAENGVVAPNRAYVGQTITLTEPQAPAGKYFDCFIIDGKHVSGNTFVVNKEGTLTVGAKFSDNEISKDNFTWGEFEFSALSGNDAQTAQIGSSEYWALEYEVYGMESGWTYTAAYVGGTHQLVGFELDGKNDKLSTYGGAWKTPNVISLTAEQSGILRGATESSPAKVTYVRAADKIAVLLNGEFMGVYSFASLEIKGDDFGIGGRAGAIKNGTLKNIKYVVGETRVGFVQEQYLGVTVTAQNGAHADKTIYFIGDTVTLTHDAPSQEGKEFAYYTVDGQKISGDSFVATKKNHVVVAVYEDICSLTLANGITANGQSGATVRVVKGSVVTLAYTSEPEQGKVLNGYKLNDSQTIYGNMFVATENTYAITADWVNASDIVWGEKNDSHDYKTVMSGSNETLQNYKYVGTAFGTSEYWAIKLDVKHTREWENLDFVVGEKVMLRMRYHQGGYFGIGLHVKTGGDDSYTQSEFYPAYPHHSDESKAIAAKFVAGTTVTCVRYGNKLSLYADNELFFTTEYAIDYTGNWFGVGYDTESPDNVAADNSLQVPNHKNVKFIMGQDKIDAFMESVKKLNAPEYDSLVKYAGGGTFEYTLPVATVTDMAGKTVNQNVTVTATGINGAITVTDGKITLPEYNGTQNVTVTYSSADCINVSITVTFYNTSVAQINEIKNATAKDSSAIEYITSNIPEGLPDDISESGVLKVVAGSGDVGMTTNVNYNTISANYSEIYFYIYMESEADLNNIGCGAYWLNGEGTVVKNQWVKITFNSEMIAQLSSGAADDLSKFTFRVNTQSWLQGTEVSGKTFYITSLYGVEKQA